jgi:hypothetical protein
MPTPIRKNPTVFPYRGKWRLSYPDKDGKTRTRTAESKQEAYRLLMAMGWLEANNRTLHTDNSVPTVAEWFEQWFIDHADDVSRSQVYVLIKSGELPSVSIRGCRRITEGQIISYIRSLEK